MNWYIKVLKNYAQFEGRARRSEYWYFILFHCIIIFALAALMGATGSAIFSALYGIYALGTFVPSLAVVIRRMHDVGKSGWFCLIPIYSLILALTEGEKGANKYGPDPKAEGMPQSV